MAGRNILFTNLLLNTNINHLFFSNIPIYKMYTYTLRVFIVIYCDEPGPTRPLVNLPSPTGNTGQNAPSLSCSFGRSIRPPFWDSPLFPSSLSIHHTGRADIISPAQTSVTRSYFEIIQLHSITATQLNHSVISPNALLHTALYRQKLSHKLL